MGILEKMKNLFTEEVDEIEVKPRKKEVVSTVERPLQRRENTVKEVSPVVEQPKMEESKEKFVFPVYFDDKDFDDLEKPKEKPKQKPLKVSKPEPYKGAKTNVEVEQKKVFKPSPIISPVYGVLDKNYSKDDITTKKENPIRRKNYSTREMSVDDIRNKAYGVLEDELESHLLDLKEFEEPMLEDIPTNQEALDIFNELDFDALDHKINRRKFEEIEKNVLMANEEIDDDTAELARQLEEQKRKLEEINQYMNETSEVGDVINTTEEEPISLNNEIVKQPASLTEDLISTPEEITLEEKTNLDDSELFDLIDSMYEKRDEK